MGRLITATQAAALVGVTSNTLSSWAKDNYFVRRLWIGNAIHYDEDAVIEWLRAENRTAPRARCGEGHWRSKWPDAFIAQVIKLGAEGVSQYKIAERLGVPRTTVRDILNGNIRNNGVRGVAQATVGRQAKNRAKK